MDGRMFIPFSSEVVFDWFCATEFTVAEAKWFEGFFRANREGTECPLQRPQD